MTPLPAATPAANPHDCTLHQINATHWYFETTQTDLPEAAYNYQAFANNISSGYMLLIVDYSWVPPTPHPFVSGANQFYTEMTCGLTNFRNDMGRYLIWAVIFFGISISFALMAKIKQTLIGGK